MAFSDIMRLALITFFPFFELRASIPYGIFKTDMHWLAVFTVCVAANIVLGPAIYALLDRSVHMMLRAGLFRKIYDKVIARTQKRVRPYVDKYGEIGLALFIGVPLPGSGSYSGALAAYVLGMDFRKFIIANTIGVILAGIAVLIVSMSGGLLFSLFVKTI